MIRVCDIDALFNPGTTCFYVVKQTEPGEFKVRKEPTMISAHREVDMLVIHTTVDDELHLPIVSYVTTKRISFKPKGFTPLSVEEFDRIIEFDTENVELHMKGHGKFVAAITLHKNKSGKIIADIDTADQMIQIIRP